MRKIVLIQCVDRKQGAPGLGLAYLASYLREKIKDIDIVILEQTPKDWHEVEKHAPNVIGISVLTPQFPDAIDFAQKLKENMDVPIIVGGSHITCTPQMMPKCFDMGVIGEGEEAFYEIISQDAFTPDKLSNIKGICYHNKDRIIITPKRPLIKDIDQIPFPAWDLLNMEHYLKGQNVFGPHFGRGTHLLTARGCPFCCVFCFSPILWRRHYRAHSPEYVVKEIKQLIKDYRVELLYLYDDISILNKKKMRRFADLLQEEGLNKKVAFGVVGRCDVFDEEICKILKKMNVIHVNFGMESGNEKILQFLKNDTLTKDQIRKAVQLTRKYGFTVDGSFVIGSPGETAENIMETLEFIRSLKMDKFGFTIATPYPGTKLWKVLEEKGMINYQIDWRSLDGNDKDVLEHKDWIYVGIDKISREEFFRLWELFEKERRKYFNYDWRDHN